MAWFQFAGCALQLEGKNTENAVFVIINDLSNY